MTAPKPLDLDAIEARADAATAGPWTTGVRWEDPYDVYWVPINSPSTNEEDPNQPDRVALIRYNAGAFQFPHYDALSDAAFIANARQDIPSLVAEVRSLHADFSDAAQEIARLTVETETLRAENDRLRRDLTANEGSEDARLAIAEAEVARLRAGAEKVIGDYTRTAEEHGAGGDRDMVDMCEVVVMKIRRDILGGQS